VLSKIGPVVLAYVIGLIIGNTNILPESFDKQLDLLTTITVPLALPLLLFSSNIKKWLSIAPKAFISMILAIASVLLTVFIGFLIFGDRLQDPWKIAGMLVGVYSGGTPNLSAIKTALHVSADTYILTHTYDLFFSALFLLFLMTIGQRTLLYFLPAFKSGTSPGCEQVSGPPSEDEMFWGLLSGKHAPSLVKGFLLSVLIFACAGGLSFLLQETAQMAFVILTLTTLGIFFSLIPPVNRLKKTFELGMYFILVFSLVVASMADISELVNISGVLIYYVAFAIFGTLIIHTLLSKLFHVDADTVIVTCTAMICSPPFVPVVAGALKNREVILSGITVGIIGFALGNYIGIFFAYLLQGM
jgi:uncharacterized membrane protein